MTRDESIEQAKLYLHTCSDQQLAELLSNLTGKYHVCNEGVIQPTGDNTADVLFVDEYTTGLDDTDLTYKQVVDAMAEDEMPDGVHVWEAVEDYSPAELINRFHKGY